MFADSVLLYSNVIVELFLLAMSENSFRASVFLCASATGRKLRPLVVFAGAPDGDIMNELRGEPEYDWERAHFAVQKKAYCDAAVMDAWIRRVWQPEVSMSSLLLLDSLKVHRMDSVKAVLEEECLTRVEFIPPGVTTLAQPMDVAVMGPFKAKCKSMYVQQVLEKGFCRDPTTRRKEIARIVIDAWAKVSRKTIVSGFVGAGLIATGPRDVSDQLALPPPPDDDNQHFVSSE